MATARTRIVVNSNGSLNESTSKFLSGSTNLDHEVYTVSFVPDRTTMTVAFRIQSGWSSQYLATNTITDLGPALGDFSSEASLPVVNVTDKSYARVNGIVWEYDALNNEWWNVGVNEATYLTLNRFQFEFADGVVENANGSSFFFGYKFTQIGLTNVTAPKLIEMFVNDNIISETQPANLDQQQTLLILNALGQIAGDVAALKLTVAGSFRILGSVENYSLLPFGAELGDSYFVTDGSLNPESEWANIPSVLYKSRGDETWVPLYSVTELVPTQDGTVPTGLQTQVNFEQVLEVYEAVFTEYEDNVGKSLIQEVKDILVRVQTNEDNIQINFDSIIGALNLISLLADRVFDIESQLLDINASLETKVNQNQITQDENVDTVNGLLAVLSNSRIRELINQVVNTVLINNIQRREIKAGTGVEFVTDPQDAEAVFLNNTAGGGGGGSTSIATFVKDVTQQFVNGDPDETITWTISTQSTDPTKFLLAMNTAQLIAPGYYKITGSFAPDKGGGADAEFYLSTVVDGQVIPPVTRRSIDDDNSSEDSPLVTVVYFKLTDENTTETMSWTGRSEGNDAELVVLPDGSQHNVTIEYSATEPFDTSAFMTKVQYTNMITDNILGSIVEYANNNRTITSSTIMEIALAEVETALGNIAKDLPSGGGFFTQEAKNDRLDDKIGLNSQQISLNALAISGLLTEIQDIISGVTKVGDAALLNGEADDVNPTPNSIAKRGTIGEVKTAMPVEDEDSANKLYVDQKDDALQQEIDDNTDSTNQNATNIETLEAAIGDNEGAINALDATKLTRTARNNGTQTEIEVIVDNIRFKTTDILAPTITLPRFYKAIITCSTEPTRGLALSVDGTILYELILTRNAIDNRIETVVENGTFNFGAFGVLPGQITTIACNADGTKFCVNQNKTSGGLNVVEIGNFTVDYTNGFDVQFVVQAFFLMPIRAFAFDEGGSNFFYIDSQSELHYFPVATPFEVVQSDLNNEVILGTVTDTTSFYVIETGAGVFQLIEQLVSSSNKAIEYEVDLNNQVPLTEIGLVKKGALFKSFQETKISYDFVSDFSIQFSPESTTFYVGTQLINVKEYNGLTEENIGDTNPEDLQDKQTVDNKVMMVNNTIAVETTFASGEKVKEVEIANYEEVIDYGEFDDTEVFIPRGQEPNGDLGKAFYTVYVKDNDSSSSQAPNRVVGIEVRVFKINAVYGVIASGYIGSKRIDLQFKVDGTTSRHAFRVSGNDTITKVIGRRIGGLL